VRERALTHADNAARAGESASAAKAFDRVAISAI
jgi:hypothetical protein